MMRGIVRSSIFALLIGMTFMIAAPRDAGATNAGWETNDAFPPGLLGASSFSDGGLDNALNHSHSDRIAYLLGNFEGDGNHEGDNGSNGDVRGRIGG